MCFSNISYIVPIGTLCFTSIPFHFIAHYPIPEAINTASSTRNADCFARHSAQKPIRGSEYKNCCRSRFLRTVSEMRDLCTRTLMKKTQNQHLPGELSKQNWAERIELWFISIRNSSSFHMVLKIWEDPSKFLWVGTTPLVLTLTSH